MTLAPVTLLALVLGYLVLLVAVAHAGDAYAAAERLAKQPWVTALALGVYATSWSYFGSVGMAAREGPLYLTIYLGPTLACAAIPWLWAPLARVLRERQLATLPDLLAFRYRSQAVGVLATAFLLAGSLPYQALQQQALVHAVEAVGGVHDPELVGALACVGLVLFGSLYGARNLGPRERHDGFVLAVALESLVKLVALGAVALHGYFGVLDGDGARTSALARAPSALAREEPWGAFLLLSASAAFLLPRQWHVAFTEGLGARGLLRVRAAFPAYLLLLTLSVPVVLAAGRVVAPHANPDFHVLDVARASGSPGLLALTFLGGISAATAMVVVSSLALASMCLTHFVLPLAGARGGDLYGRVRWLRRVLIAAIVVAGYGVSLLLRGQRGLSDLGLVSFAAVVQFVPGLLGVLFWPRATARAVLWGLCVGGLSWGLALGVPMLVSTGALAPGADLLAGVRGTEPWGFALALSLGGNTLAFIMGALSRAPSPSELEAAAVCRSELRAPGAAIGARSVDELAARLAPVLGEQAARAEVERARLDLGQAAHERRPRELRRLRDRIEQNLSGLVGPVLAHGMVEAGLSPDPSLRSAVTARLLLAPSGGLRTAPARELERARRYLLGIVEQLPEGVCTVDDAGEILLWNAAIARITGISADDAVGHALAALPAPWGALLGGARRTGSEKREHRVEVRGALRELVLWRSEISAEGERPGGGAVLMLEDQTDARALSARFAHRERLASLGALAAGVAHEIGNPLTGIASVAQNVRHELDAPDAAERLGLIVEQTKRIDRIVRTLVSFAHAPSAEGPPLERERLRLAELLEEAVTLSRLGRAGRRVLLRVEAPAALYVTSDRQRLVQILVNLTQNACDASPDGAEVLLSAEREGERVVLRVRDHGVGMTEDQQSRAFQPFYTTKPRGAGTGLGLSLVAGFVAELGGTLGLESEPRAGTTVSVRLPAGDGS